MPTVSYPVDDMVSCVADCRHCLVIDINDGLGKQEIESFMARWLRSVGDILIQDFLLHNKQQK